MTWLRTVQTIEETRYLVRGYRHTLISTIFNWQNAVILHNMGKVGSSTVFGSLIASEAVREKNLYRTHFLSKKGVQLIREVHENGYGGWQNFPPNIKSMVMAELVKSKLFRWRFSEHSRCKVVTLVRDPIATNIAGFFQNYLWWPDEVYELCRNRPSECLEELTKCFLDKYPHDYPLNWFDWELGGVHGIDIKAEGFPTSRGWKIYKQKHADILVIRLDMLNSGAKEAFKELLAIDDFDIVNDNVADKKWYADLYNEFKNSIVLPEAYISKIYDSQWVQHFYSAEEISAFKIKYRREGVMKACSEKPDEVDPIDTFV
ncbi:MAG: putative capsular polysaccharide synthesis family protein [Methylococcales bacterium]